MSEDLTIDGFLSLNECREAIKRLAGNIAGDISSTMVNGKRIESLRVLVDLFENYNNILKRKEDKTAPSFGDLLRQAILSNEHEK